MLRLLSLTVFLFVWAELHSVMLDVMRVSNNIITDLMSPFYAPLCLHLISPNDNIKGYDVQSKKPKLLTSWTWKYYIPIIIASTTYLTSYTDDVNGRWHANISQYSGIKIIKALCIYWFWQLNLYITWLGVIPISISEVHLWHWRKLLFGGKWWSIFFYFPMHPWQWRNQSHWI